jgi:small subunit ribosomal protein S16
LRLRRAGKKKAPIYHIVAADSRTARSGKFLEIVGRYEPLKNPEGVSTKDARVVYWLNKGALPTETVRGLLRRSGLWLQWTLSKRGLPETRVAEEMEKWKMAQSPKRQRAAEKRTRRAAARKKAKSPAQETPVAPEQPA